jgi:carbamate kinase
VKLVIAVDGDLLVSANSGQGMQEQRDAIVHITNQLGKLVENGHQLVITHGNAPQVGYVLLRGEAARHVVHSLPLDICGADTQGATGYMLQQALKNWLSHHGNQNEVSTIVTQVTVGEAVPVGAPCTKGIGPFFDMGRAQSVKIKRGWDLDLIPGQGYQRVVPCMTPVEIIEANSIRFLMDHNVVVICGGGGGIPVKIDENGDIYGVEAVVDKAYTAVLLAKEIGTYTIVFVSPWEKIVSVFDLRIDNPLTQFNLGEFEKLIDSNKEMEDTMLHKLIASRNFLQDGGRSVLIIPPDQLSLVPEECSGIRLCVDKLESLPG